MPTLYIPFTSFRFGFKPAFRLILGHALTQNPLIFATTTVYFTLALVFRHYIPSPCFRAYPTGPALGVFYGFSALDVLTSVLQFTHGTEMPLFFPSTHFWFQTFVSRKPSLASSDPAKSLRYTFKYIKSHYFSFLEKNIFFFFS